MASKYDLDLIVDGYYDKELYDYDSSADDYENYIHSQCEHNEGVYYEQSAGFIDYIDVCCVVCHEIVDRVKKEQ